MLYRGFEVHFCPLHQQNICVEATTNQDGSTTKRCLYQQRSCRNCRYACIPDKPRKK